MDGNCLPWGGPEVGLCWEDDFLDLSFLEELFLEDSLLTFLDGLLDLDLESDLVLDLLDLVLLVDDRLLDLDLDLDRDRSLSFLEDLRSRLEDLRLLLEVLRELLSDRRLEVRRSECFLSLDLDLERDSSVDWLRRLRSRDMEREESLIFKNF